MKFDLASTMALVAIAASAAQAAPVSAVAQMTDTGSHIPSRYTSTTLIERSWTDVSCLSCFKSLKQNVWDYKSSFLTNLKPKKASSDEMPEFSPGLGYQASWVVQDGVYLKKWTPVSGAKRKQNPMLPPIGKDSMV